MQLWHLSEAEIKNAHILSTLYQLKHTTCDVCSQSSVLFFFWRHDLGETPHIQGLYMCLMQTRLPTFHVEPLPSVRIFMVPLAPSGRVNCQWASGVKKPKETKQQ